MYKTKDIEHTSVVHWNEKSIRAAVPPSPKIIKSKVCLNWKVRWISTNHHYKYTNKNSYFLKCTLFLKQILKFQFRIWTQTRFYFYNLRKELC